MTTENLTRRLAGGTRKLAVGMRKLAVGARKLTRIVREMNDAVRLMTELRLTRPLGFGREAPSTYPEFLLRTSATSAREETAARRQDQPRRACPGGTGGSRDYVTGADLPG